MKRIRFLNREASAAWGNQVVDWSKGPWEHEPDFAEFIHKETGYLIRALRHDRTGHWNGYVGVPLEHPASGLYSECELPSYVHSAAHVEISFMGQTGSENLGFTPTDDGRNWGLIGFDTNHHGDIDPVAASASKRGVDDVITTDTMYSDAPVNDDGRSISTYKSMKFVLEHCEQLARQLKYMEPIETRYKRSGPFPA
jgi:hypothetical protein